jgi:hypothetical protein
MANYAQSKYYRDFGETGLLFIITIVKRVEGAMLPPVE